MSLNLSIDLSTARFTDLAALIQAAKQAGAGEETTLDITRGAEGEPVTLTIVVDNPTPGAPISFDRQADKLTRRASEDTSEIFDAAGQLSDQVRSTVNTGSDAALRLIAELLKGGPGDHRR